MTVNSIPGTTSYAVGMPTSSPFLSPKSGVKVVSPTHRIASCDNYEVEKLRREFARDDLTVRSVSKFEEPLVPLDSKVNEVDREILSVDAASNGCCSSHVFPKDNLDNKICPPTSLKVVSNPGDCSEGEPSKDQNPRDPQSSGTSLSTEASGLTVNSSIDSEKPDNPPQPDADKKSVEDIPNTFRELQKTLPLPKKWSVTLSLIIASFTESSNLTWSEWFYSYKTGAANYLRAHLWKGVLSSGRGQILRNDQLGPLARQEKAALWGTLQKNASDFSTRYEISNPEFARLVKDIEDDMKFNLGQLSVLCDEVPPKPVSDLDENGVLYKIRMQQFRRNPNNHILAQIECLLRKGIDFDASSGKYSAIIGKLMLDQVVLDSISIHCNEWRRPAADEKMSDEDMLKQAKNLIESSAVHEIRRLGFHALDQYTNFVRTLDYTQNGLSQKGHKLPYILAKGAKIDEANVPEYFSSLVMGMTEGQTFQFSGGWNRAFTPGWYFAFDTIGFAGASAGLTVEEAYAYGISFRNEDGNIVLHFDRAGAFSTSVGFTGWLGDYINAMFKGVSERWTIFFLYGARLERAARRQDSLAIKLGPAGHPATREALKDFLAGRITAPEALLGDEGIRAGTSENTTTWRLYVKAGMETANRVGPAIADGRDQNGQAMWNAPSTNLELSAGKFEEKDTVKTTGTGLTTQTISREKKSTWTWFSEVNLSVFGGFFTRIRDVNGPSVNSMNGPAQTQTAGSLLTRTFDTSWMGGMLRAIFSEPPKTSDTKKVAFAPSTPMGKIWGAWRTVNQLAGNLCLLAVAVPLWLVFDVILWGTVNSLLLLVSRTQRNAFSRWLREPAILPAKLENGDDATDLIFPRQWEIKADYFKELRDQMGEQYKAAFDRQIDDALCYTDTVTRASISKAVCGLGPEYAEWSKFIKGSDRKKMLNALRDSQYLAPDSEKVIGLLEDDALWQKYRVIGGRDAASKITIRVPGKWSIPKYGYCQRFYHACRRKTLIRNKLLREETGPINSGVTVGVPDDRKLSSAFNLIVPFLRWGSQTDLTLSEPNIKAVTMNRAGFAGDPNS